MTSDQDPDVHLMLALKAGDDSAFRKLFEKHAAAVVRYAMQLVGSRARAEEIAQDVFLQIYRRRSSYEPSARFLTYLYRITSNACISEMRRAEHKQHTYSLDGDPAADDGQERLLPDANLLSGEEALGRRELLYRLDEALARLPPQQRAALLLARMEGQSYEEVAHALSCSVSAVKSLIHRGTITLRRCFEKEVIEP